MTSAEAIEVVHQMMDARDREQEQKRIVVAEKPKAESTLWKEVLHGVAVYGTMTLWAVMFTLLMAVLQ